MQDTETEQAIKKGLSDKLDTMTRRELYTQYKTAPTVQEQEQARQKYLDSVGIPESFRW